MTDFDVSTALRLTKSKLSRMESLKEKKISLIGTIKRNGADDFFKHVERYFVSLV